MLGTASLPVASDSTFSILPPYQSKCPRVLLVTDSRNPSGVGEHMVTLASALKDEAEVRLVLADTPDAQVWAGKARAAQLAAMMIHPHALETGGSEYAAVLN